jgi:hypothetical protein
VQHLFSGYFMIAAPNIIISTLLLGVKTKAADGFILTGSEKH